VAQKDLIKVLRQLHDRGKLANRKGEERKRIWGTLEQLGAETSTAKNRLMEARKFARRCDEKELDFLCRLRKKGWLLTWSHVLQLIRVDDNDERRKLAKDCAANAWSSRRLQREIDLRGLHRPYGGRKQQPPESNGQELLVTERLLCSVIRWASVVGTVASGTSKSSNSRVNKPKRAKPVKKKSPPTMTEIRARLHDFAIDAYELCELVRDKLEARRHRSPKRVRPAKSALHPRKKGMRAK
jgi:hypothetical protein